MQKTIVISGINMVEGGIFTILDNCLQKISEYNHDQHLKIFALVHDKSKFNYPNLDYIEFPKSKKYWFYRFYYEYFYFKKLSKKLKPNIWLSLHDVSPNVTAKKQFLYYHHPTTFYKANWNDWRFDYKVGVFSIFYKGLTQINLKKNNTIFVQQHWIKEAFEKHFNIQNIKVALPEFTEEKTTKNIDLESDKFHFFFPSYPRTFKNFELIFDAIEKLEPQIRAKIQVHLTTIKDNPNRFAKHLFEKYNHLKEVNFLPNLDRKDILKYYNSIDCLIFPSKLETWGLPISEAKSYQKPILASNLSYAREAVGNYEKVSFFNPDDAQELAKILTDFVNQTIQYEGNIVTFDKTNELLNWFELFDFMLEERINYRLQNTDNR